MSLQQFPEPLPLPWTTSIKPQQPHNILEGHGVLIDLVQTTTRDGIRLDGAYQAAAMPAALPLDGICCLHGTGGNFYSSTLFDALAERFLALGVSVLRVNTRGHDLMSNAQTASGGRRLGAASEAVDDCRHDVAAWLGWLRQRAGLRVGLLGHSLGAVKALYALACEPDLGAACLIALSPPRLSHSWFAINPEGPEFLDIYREADGHVRAGRPQTLLDVRLPLPFVVTAAGYVEKYGPDERYNYLRFAEKIRCPTLITLGSIESANNMAFRGAAEALQEVASRCPHLRVETIEKADHFYSGVRDELIASIEHWLRAKST
jgi:alpha-beta hydrolase superfamily lysophospholipase